MLQIVKKFLRLLSIEIFNSKKIYKFENSELEISIKKKNQHISIILVNKFINLLFKSYFILKINPVDAENIQFYLYEKKPKNFNNNSLKQFRFDSVAICGFGSSGSSLIIDYLSQYNCFINPKPKGNPFEFRFIKDPGGLLDFRDSILNSNYFWNNYSNIQSYINQIYISARPAKKNIITKLFWDYDSGFYTGFNLEKITNKKFIDDLLIVKYKFKWWNNYRHFNFFYQLINNVVNKFNSEDESCMVLFKKLPTDILDEKIRRYLNKVFFEIISYNLENFYWHNKDLHTIKKFSLILDQGVAPYAANKSLSVLPDNSKVIIVYRDPRDIYLSNEGFFPEDPEFFCKIYESEINEALKQNDKRILHIKFEDFVFRNKYEIERLEKFLEIDKSYAYLEPKKTLRSGYNLSWSESRIGKWKNIKNKSKEIDYIKNRLKDLCYEGK